MIEYICPWCGAVTRHPDDVANKYCPRCHEFEDMRRAREELLARRGGPEVTEPPRFPYVDFSPNVTRADKRESHLHQLKPLPDPNGNRAERRQAKKARRRKAK